MFERMRSFTSNGLERGETKTALALSGVLLDDPCVAVGFRPTGSMFLKARSRCSRRISGPVDMSLFQIENPRTAQRVTFVGTMHVSNESVIEVEREIRSQKPDVVVIEIDRSRLGRLELTDEDFALPYRTSEDIELPPSSDDLAEAQLIAAGDGWWWRPVYAVFLELLTSVIDIAKQRFYDKAGKDWQARPGGEFAAAVCAANELGVPIVLADQGNRRTLKRIIELIRRSGETPLDIFSSYSKVVSRVLAIEPEELQGEDIDGTKRAKVKEAMAKLQSDPEIIEKLQSQLSEEVPSIFQGMIGERDAVMTQAVLRELNGPSPAEHVLVVVGAGHVPGMKSLIQSSFQRQQEEHS